MWETIVGGLLAILGGWGATWYQSRNTRKLRMDEVVAERKIQVNAEAYSCMKRVQSHLLQSDVDTTSAVIQEYEEWFFDNRLFLPGHYPEKWLTVRNNVGKLRLWEKSNSKTPEEIAALDKAIEKAVEDAIDEIYKDMGLKRLELKDANNKQENSA